MCSLSVRELLVLCSQDNVKQVDGGENFTAEVLTDTVSDGERHTDAITQLNSHSGLPVDSGQDDNVLIRFSELADKYWNGSKSLLKNQRFTSQHHMFTSLYYSQYCSLCAVSSVTSQSLYNTYSIWPDVITAFWLLDV